MKKILSLFQRNCDGDRLVRDAPVPGAEWCSPVRALQRERMTERVAW